MLSLQPAPRSASLARRVGAAVATLGLTLGYSIWVLFLAALGRLRRERIDRYTRRWSATLLRLVRARLSVEGELPDLRDGRRYMILCNHSSLYDIPASFAALPGSIRMLAKQELFAIPILGRAMRAAEFPSIDRKTGQRALADLQRARAMMESGIVLWAAPEGTRSNGEELLPFKKGCFRLARDTDAVIIPVVIHGIHRVLPAHTLNLNLDQVVQVRIGAPIDTADFAGQTTQALMAAVRERMQALFDAPPTPPVSAAPPREPALAE